MAFVDRIEKGDTNWQHISIKQLKDMFCFCGVSSFGPVSGQAIWLKIGVVTI